MAADPQTLANGTTVYITDRHRFGTDAFLLTDFAAPKAAQRVADLGSGCGIIPLICADRYHPAEVWGVEIQQEAHKLLCRAVRENKNDTIRPLCADIRALPPGMPRGGFDLVLANPPYTEQGGGIPSARGDARIARHETLCTFADIASAARDLLRFRGRLCVCQRPARLVDVMAKMRRYGLEPKRMRMVQKHPHTPPWLVLVEGVKGGRPFLKIEPPLIVYEGTAFSAQMLAVYNKR